MHEQRNYRVVNERIAEDNISPVSILDISRVGGSFEREYQLEGFDKQSFE
jgi:hypothetical protein